MSKQGMQSLMKPVAAMVLVLVALTGCKYYGGALPPENPVSMDTALQKAGSKNYSVGPDGNPLPPVPRPQINRPSYLPEKELAVVAPPKTLLVWNFPHVTDDNTRVFGNWATIFLTDRYEWVLPDNEQALNRPEVVDGRR